MSSDHTWIRNSEIAALRRDASRSYKAEQKAQEIKARAEQRERDIRSQYESSITSLSSQINTISRQHNAELRQASEDFRNNIARQAGEFKERLERQRAQNQQDIYASEQRANERLENQRMQTQRDINSLEQRTNERIEHQRVQTQRDINSLEQRVYLDLGQMNTIIHDMNSRFTESINDFGNWFNALATREADKRECAEALLTEMEDMLAGVAALKPEKYNAGGLFAQMNEQLARARNSYAQGHYEAAIGIVNVRLTDIAALQQRLALENTAFSALLAEVREAANALRGNVAMLTDGEPVHSFPHNGETITLPYDIDHWTNGRFNDFCRDMDGIERRLTTAENDSAMGFEQLEEIRGRLASWVGDNGYLRLLDEEGKQNQISSIAIDVMTARVYEALEEQGWRMVDSGRHEGDDRNPCTILYEDNVGNRVALIVSSSNDPTVTPVSYDVYANGEDNADSEYTRSIENGVETTIARLQGRGVEHGRTEHRNDCHLNPTPEAFFRNTVTNINREQATRS